MGYSKPKETTRAYLESQALPTHGKSYTVTVIFFNNGFIKNNSYYRII